MPCSFKSTVLRMDDEVLIVLDDAPYGTEKTYNGLRLAIALQARKNPVRLFLMADTVFAGIPNQETPPGYYNIGEMLGRVLANGGLVAACGGCMKARGIKVEELIEGIEQGSMALFSEWTEKCDKIHSF